MLLGAVLVLGSCHDDPCPDPVTGDTGSINLRSMGIEISNAEKVIETSRASMDLSAYIVEIVDDKDNLVKTWDYASMPEVFELPVGSYVARVHSHRVTKADFDKPYFMGEKAFDVVNDSISDLGKVTCKLSNIKVTVNYEEQLLRYLGNDAKVVVIANDQGRLEFVHPETRAGYFEALPGSSTIVVEFSGTVNGTFLTKRITMTDAQAGHHRKITIKGNFPIPDPEDPTGGIDPGTGIGIDMDVDNENLNGNVSVEEEIIPGDRPGGEEPGGEEPGPGPGDENTIHFESANLDFDNPNQVSDDSEGVVDIYAPKGITHFMVDITSSNENFIASAGELLPLSFDLAYPGAAEEDFKRLGFPTGSEVIDAEYLKFDISKFIPLLGAFPGTHRFQLSVQDKDNKQLIKTLVFIAN